MKGGDHRCDNARGGDRRHRALAGQQSDDNRDNPGQNQWRNGDMLHQGDNRVADAGIDNHLFHDAAGGDHQ